MRRRKRRRKEEEGVLWEKVSAASFGIRLHFPVFRKSWWMNVSSKGLAQTSSPPELASEGQDKPWSGREEMLWPSLFFFFSVSLNDPELLSKPSATHKLS